ncbi:hypothetical protein [Pseudotamlana agarivorans]|uniref:hypothetical protein n=1 Tax=Pseudotamlana agarivorans TaxID=481183 RepID=UPI00082D0CFA|nr:hypothetical protein [Tamlana agarivorans]
MDKVNLFVIKHLIEITQAYKLSKIGMLGDLEIDNNKFPCYNTLYHSLMFIDTSKQDEGILELLVSNGFELDRYKKAFAEGFSEGVDSFNNETLKKSCSVKPILTEEAFVDSKLKNDQLVLSAEVFKYYGQLSGIKNAIIKYKTEKKGLFLEAEIEETDSGKQLLPAVNVDSKTALKQKLKLSDLITHEKSTEIVEGVKVQYKNIKGKGLKILLLALQKLNLLPEERIAKKFHDCCKVEFDWDIASYNAMNGHKFNDLTDFEELEKKKQYIKSIIK